MSVVAPSAYTTQQVVHDALRHLLTGGREKRNRLSAPMDTDDTSFAVSYALNGIKEGSRVSVGLEDMYVWAADGTTVTVERGQFGTGAEAHATGDIVAVNPRFSDAEIVREINSELADLSTPTNGLYRVATTELTYGVAEVGYALPADAIDVLELRWRQTGPWKSWPLVQNWEVSQSADTDDFAGGIALFIGDWLDPSASIRVAYKARFGPTTTLTDVVTSVTGVPTTAVDILALGAAIRLGAGREVRRNFTETQGDTRRAEEVPPGAILGSTRNLIALRAQRVTAEAARLADLYPAQNRHRRYGVAS